MSTEGAHNKDANIHQNKYYFKKGIAMCYIKKFSKENANKQKFLLHKTKEDDTI